MGRMSNILRQAKSLIEDKSKWCRNAYAFTESGLRTTGYDADACKFCSIGALQRVLPLGTGGAPAEFTEAVVTLDRATEGSLIHTYNDNHTHAEVMRLWDNAISLAEKEELAQ